MRFLKLIILLFFIWGWGGLFVRGVSAQEKTEEKPSPLKIVQDQQQRIFKEFEQKKKDLQDEIQKALKDYQEQAGAPTRQQLINENKEKQEKLRQWFREETRHLQAAERKIRFGRESLERPMFESGQPAKGQTPKENLDDRQKRADLKRRIEDQDKLFMKNNEVPPVAPPAPSLTPTPTNSIAPEVTPVPESEPAKAPGAPVDNLEPTEPKDDSANY